MSRSRYKVRVYLRRGVALLFVAAMALMAGISPASAVVAPDPDTTGPGDFFGCANYDIFSGIAPSSKTITGWIIAAVVVVALLVILLGAFKVILANRRIDRAEEGLRSIKQAFIGIAIGIVGLPLSLAIVTTLSKSFCA